MKILVIGGIGLLGSMLLKRVRDHADRPPQASPAEFAYSVADPLALDPLTFDPLSPTTTRPIGDIQ